ncbi:unnamed protein product [Strongylus vulgaris]|uniref:Uncharacterized protein n=1 Tax=Strongylus vulgaris TaxID=40348 RepID=A0A3P7I9Y2_STRVU|nr:unnamed protein product [Strongylus vulgaris]
MGWFAEPVRPEQGRAIAEQIGAFAYLECSAKTKDVRYPRSIRKGNASSSSTEEEEEEQVRAALKKPPHRFACFVSHLVCIITVTTRLFLVVRGGTFFDPV